ncbi:MAG: carboxypeptidase regulatory-like domain-containing protein [Streptosporangiaceae bacterium]
MTAGLTLAAAALLAVGPAQAATVARDGAAAAMPQPGPAPQLTTNTSAPCGTPRKNGFARCFAIVRTPSDHKITADASGPPPGALAPADIQSAYKLPTAGGGQTVAVVDAYGDSHAESDLATFRSHYGLPPCTTANGCFTKVNQTGGTTYPGDDPGWALETSLDLDAVSSACPACNILLVEGNSPAFGDLGTAVDEAVSLGAKFVSNSYGLSPEDNGELSYDHFYNDPGVAVTVSSGDIGNATSWPSTDPDVVAAGGTTLTKNASVPRGWTETAWSSGGSGCSPYEPRPDYQLGITTDCTMRAAVDIAADADPASGLATYDTLGQSGWLQVGGTSLASPLIASMYALAGTPVPGTYPVTYPYHAPSQDLFDITQGSNGSCGNLLCSAGPGWDGPTGLGTPDGVNALVSGPHGDITGKVTDASTGKPVAGATVSASPGDYITRTGPSGSYDLNAAVGTYRVTAAAYAYRPVTRASVAVTANQATTANFVLTELPHATVSGAVTDGSGHGWPLYAQITINGYPGGPVYTNPFTGRYSVVLAGPATYSVQVVSANPPVTQPPGDGYNTKTLRLAVGTGPKTRNIALTADTSACTAPGYGWDGLSEDFTGWARAPRDGWTVTGTAGGWRFDNPGSRPPPGRDDDFAIADSGYTGGRMDTALTSPAANLTGQSAPHLTFDTAYYATPHGQAARVDLSTDGGKTWSTIWQRTVADTIGPVDIPIPQAAGHASVRVRFRYTGDDDWWWAVDDVLVGTRACVPEAGGILAGLVTSRASGRPVDGATVTSAAVPGVSGISTGTSDPSLPGGFYSLFTPVTGSQKFATATTGYATATATVNVAAGQVTRHDWALTAAGNG